MSSLNSITGGSNKWGKKFPFPIDLYTDEDLSEVVDIVDFDVVEFDKFIKAAIKKNPNFIRERLPAAVFLMGSKNPNI